MGVFNRYQRLILFVHLDKCALTIDDRCLSQNVHTVNAIFDILWRILQSLFDVKDDVFPLTDVVNSVAQQLVGILHVCYMEQRKTLATFGLVETG